MLILALSLFGCNGGEGGNTVAVDFAMGQLQTDSRRATQYVGFYPESFQVTVWRVELVGDQDAVLYDSESGDYVQLATGGAANSVIDVSGIEIPYGTYTGLNVSLQNPQSGEGEFPLVAGCATVDGTEYCTKADFGENASGAPSEDVAVDIAVDFTTPFAEPLVIGTEGEDADSDTETATESGFDLHLVYDLSGILGFRTEMPAEDPRVYADGVQLDIQEVPTFSFFGAAPAAEIYELRITEDPDPDTFPALADFSPDFAEYHTRIWLYFDDNDQPIGFKSIYTADEPARESGLSFRFQGDPDISSNGDDTWTLTSDEDCGECEQVTLSAFERADHTGELTFYEESFWSGNGESGSGKTFPYEVTRLQ